MQGCHSSFKQLGKTDEAKTSFRGEKLVTRVWALEAPALDLNPARGPRYAPEHGPL